MKEYIGIALGIAGMIGAIYMWIMSRNSKIDVLENRIQNLENECKELKARQSKTEDAIYMKLETIIESIYQIKIQIESLKKP
jgi:beta-lactam-binding protein with PASTA domain